MIEILNLPLETISIGGGTQSRVALNESTVAEYAEVIRLGGDLPPIVVFNDGAADSLWLADGFHRYHAHRAAGATDIACDVRVGTKRDAILHSVGANATHGLRRTNEDKRRAVMTLLDDMEWSGWSDNAIARACAVSAMTVGRVRAEAAAIYNKVIDAALVRTVERNGITYEQQTANIGRAARAPAPPAAGPLDTPSDEIRTKAAPVVQVDTQDDAPDLAQLASELQRENESYQRQIQSLEADDPKAELARLNQHLDQLNGRLQGEINTRNEAQSMVKHYATLLEKIRKVLKVESNRDILAALEAR